MEEAQSKYAEAIQYADVVGALAQFSLQKETLRFFTFAPYATPRRSVKPVALPNGVTIPTGTTFIMNAQEVNHDAKHFGPDSWSFNPYRFMDSNPGLSHVAFGTGSQICPAVAISNRIIYALLTRLILAFEMVESTTPGRRPNVDAVDFSDVHDELVAHLRFYNAHFQARDETLLKRVLAEKRL